MAGHLTLYQRTCEDIYMVFYVTEAVSMGIVNGHVYLVFDSSIWPYGV